MSRRMREAITEMKITLLSRGKNLWCRIQSRDRKLSFCMVREGRVDAAVVSYLVCLVAERCSHPNGVGLGMTATFLRSTSGSSSSRTKHWGGRCTSRDGAAGRRSLSRRVVRGWWPARRWPERRSPPGGGRQGRCGQQISWSELLSQGVL